MLAARKKEMPSSGEAAEALAALDRKTAELMGVQGNTNLGVFGLTVPCNGNGHATRGVACSNRIIVHCSELGFRPYGGCSCGN